MGEAHYQSPHHPSKPISHVIPSHPATSPLRRFARAQARLGPEAGDEVDAGKVDGQAHGVEILEAGDWKELEAGCELRKGKVWS